MYRFVINFEKYCLYSSEFFSIEKCNRELDIVRSKFVAGCHIEENIPGIGWVIYD